MRAIGAFATERAACRVDLYHSGCAVLLEVRSDNIAATSLYQDMGFDVVGRRKRYYADGGDALLLTRSPIGSTL